MWIISDCPLQAHFGFHFCGESYWHNVPCSHEEVPPKNMQHANKLRPPGQIQHQTAFRVGQTICGKRQAIQSCTKPKAPCAPLAAVSLNMHYGSVHKNSHSISFNFPHGYGFTRQRSGKLCRKLRIMEN